VSRIKCRKAIAFCCNEAYRPYALFAAYRIATLRKEKDFDIYICDAEAFDIPPALSDLGIASLALNPGMHFAGLSTDDRRCNSAYYRLLLPSRLGEAYDRILYLDADIHVQGGDFSRLLELDLHGSPIAAVRDNPQWRTPGRLPKDFKALDLPYAPYFNSGVMVIDTATWKDKAIDDRIASCRSQYGKSLKRHDQTLLNAVLHGDWAEISPVWNWQYSKAARLHEALVSANIIHFIGREKPWNATDGSLAPRFGRDLSRFLADHLPVTPEISATQPIDLRNKSVISMLLRHVWNRRKMARYLDLFRDEYVAVKARPRTARVSTSGLASLRRKVREQGFGFSTDPLNVQRPPTGK